jgi:hypothetical protein
MGPCVFLSSRGGLRNFLTLGEDRFEVWLCEFAGSANGFQEAEIYFLIVKDSELAPLRGVGKSASERGSSPDENPAVLQT